METTTAPAVVLGDSLTIPDAVTIGRPDHRGKVNASDVFTREELQAIVQQAHDRYGITADPFATPGSADVDPAVAALVDDHSRCRTIGEWYGVPVHAFAPVQS